jgi:redox-sensitive bicupin YhaK (pirin superfamily)
MKYYRPENERGRANFGWLDSHHTFSFGSYYDAKHMGLSVLRVINDDVVDAGAGFDTHSHEDMEIISYVLAGSIEHKDSMGHVSVLKAGEVQRMSAGTGVSHSEYNPSKTESLRFLQIWIVPAQKGIEPDYQQKEVKQTSQLTPLVTPTGYGDSLSINQDAYMHRLELKPHESFELTLNARTGYLHVISGTADVSDQLVCAGDGLGITDEASIPVLAGTEGVIALWFDLPGSV